MAVTKHILKVTERDAVVKVGGTTGSDTIVLATDLLTSREVANGPQVVTIKQIFWCGAVDGSISITRNSVDIATIYAGSNSQLDFADSMFVDNVESQSDIVVTITNAAFCWIHLVKNSGYNLKIENAQFGQYDDPNQVGS